MDEISLAFYRLGLRLRQAVLTQEHTDRKREVEDLNSCRHALARLAVAFESWSRRADAGGIKRLGGEILESAHRQLEAASRCEHDVAPNVPVAGQVRVLEGACAEVVAVQRGDAPSHAAWFRLGGEIASVEYVPPAGRMFVEGEAEPRRKPGRADGPVWRWLKPASVEALLAELKVPRGLLFPEAAPAEGVDGFADSLPDFPFAAGWVVLEVGLTELTRSEPGATGLRPRHARDHQFLRWYEAEGEATYRSPAEIRDRWNRLHPREVVTREVVVKAIKRARQERRP